MPLNFPTSPSPNEIYTYSGRSWLWNGVAWDSYNSGNFVNTLNGFTGGVTLAAGTNVSVSNSLNTITISSTASGGITGNYVTSVNGQTGAITDVAKTNISQTFTEPQIFTAGVSGSGGITLSDSNIIGNLNITGQLIVDGAIITKTAFYGFTGDADEEPVDFVDLDGGSY
jgi:hypothetical protein